MQQGIGSSQHKHLNHPITWSNGCSFRTVPALQLGMNQEQLEAGPIIVEAGFSYTLRLLLKGYTLRERHAALRLYSHE